jgi:hypothetical protein
MLQTLDTFLISLAATFISMSPLCELFARFR